MGANPAPRDRSMAAKAASADQRKAPSLWASAEGADKAPKK